MYSHLSIVTTCLYFSLDCRNPTESAGYTLAATPGSTVEGATATVQCASGYTGTATSITCQSSGSWTTFSGCAASGISTEAFCSLRNKSLWAALSENVPCEHAQTTQIQIILRMRKVSFGFLLPIHTFCSI